jgi:hypothetical protein
MKTTFITITSIASLAAVSPPTRAHHSFAMFDADRTVTLSGTVREFQFTNPHCFIQLLVDDAGKTVEWSVEMAAPAHLVTSGWTRSTVKPGDKVTVVIHPLREGSQGGSFVSATGADGRPL